MKRLILLLILFSLTIVCAQRDTKRSDRNFSKKFEELQKIKLIETLDLSEESGIKFFARRNAHNNNVREIRKEEDRIISEMENLIKIGGSDKQYQDLLNKLDINENKLTKEQSTFIKSLHDILSKEQILKFVIFEKRFRENVKELLIEKGRKKYFKDRTD